VYITAFAPALWDRLKAIAGLPELDEERFSTQAGRLAHNDELQAVLTGWTLTRTTAELHELALRGYPFTTSETQETLLRSAQWQHRRVAREVEHPAAGRFSLIGAPWYEPDGMDLPPAPLLGEANAELLARRRGVVMNTSDHQLALLREIDGFLVAGRSTSFSAGLHPITVTSTSLHGRVTSQRSSAHLQRTGTQQPCNVHQSTSNGMQSRSTSCSSRKAMEWCTRRAFATSLAGGGTCSAGRCARCVA
jgi:hypothetical protein